MINLFAAAAAASGAAAIAADWNEQRHRSFYLLKPLTTLLIVGIAASQGGTQAAQYRELIIGALLVSTLGDVCLMFPGHAWFAAGLGSFLLAHLLFVGAFIRGLHPIAVPAYAWLVVPYGAALLWFLLPRAGPLKIPVMIYCAAIGAMVLAAAARQSGLGTPSALCALLGALLFLASDSALAMRQFGGPYAGAQALILSTYWLAVGLIASSV